ncbi:putative calmodulin-like protein 6 isoform X1 [Cucurbita pepo subsp. pepo]|uniref:putative calmodulin-like protein 6 isoform X1 n=1 Tax=Cucurbita pepo subsp. pepo TaxID=3664 RepID=UPI000C9D3F5B|nr:putative calmodulin-like protein 6 isoform X1 [Cucurbita pepo subsp. pepo]
MPASKFQTWAEDEANRLMKKYDTNGDGMLTKEELQVFLHKARGSTQLNNNQGFVSKIPKASNNVVHKHSSNSHMKHKKQVQDKGKKSSTKFLDGEMSKLQLSREQMKEIFKNHDSNKDGFLDIKEVTKAFGFLGSILPFNKAHYAMTYADTNHDGLISEFELDKLIDYASKFINKK